MLSNNLLDGNMVKYKWNDYYLGTTWNILVYCASSCKANTSKWGLNFNISHKTKCACVLFKFHLP